MTYQFVSYELVLVYLLQSVNLIWVKLRSTLRVGRPYLDLGIESTIMDQVKFIGS